MKGLGLTAVNDNNRPTAGGYVLQITNVDDIPVNPATGKGDYLRIEYDIYEGEFAGYYQDMFSSLGFWGGKFIRSYKPKALGMFKQFINSVKKDNPEFKWDMDGENDERKLIGCKLGAVIGEEEYRGNDGSVKTRLYVSKIVPIDTIKAGSYKVPELKRLQGSMQPVAAVDTTDTLEAITEDTPF